MSLDWTKHASKCIRCDLSGWNAWVVRMEGAESETQDSPLSRQSHTWSYRGSFQLKPTASTLLVQQCGCHKTLRACAAPMLVHPHVWSGWCALTCAALLPHPTYPHWSERTLEESQPNDSVSKLKAFPAHTSCHHFLHFPTYHECFGQHSEAVAMI